MTKRFTESGMWKIPTNVEHLSDTKENEPSILINSAFCKNGHSLIDKEHTFDGRPGIKLAFDRKNGEEGLFVVSSKLNDLNKVGLKGDIVDGEKVILKCPVCSEPFPILSPCDKCDGEMVVIYCTDDFDINDSVSFCDVFGCPNAMLIKSDKVIMSIERDTL